MKCDICGNYRKALYAPTQKGKKFKWVKVGWYCPYCYSCELTAKVEGKEHTLKVINGYEIKIIESKKVLTRTVG